MHNVLFVLLRRLHLPLIVLICVYGVSIIGFVLIPGIDDQGRPWHMGFFHAFYFVSITGTTIGFGEIPYPFTDAQRMWSLVSIYATVIAWLYAIGSMLAIIQDQNIRKLVTTARFRRNVARMREPFYLVCGYGDTGSMLIHAFAEVGIRAVVIDIDAERINELELEDYNLFVPGLGADADQPANLLAAGLRHRHCAGVVALTNDDSVNLKISITSKLLVPSMLTIARAEHRDVQLNIASFGTEHIINPFEVFAERLAMALHSPGLFLLYEWLTSVPHEKLKEPLFPPHGKWLLCGYGRFGKAVYQRLLDEGVDVTVIELDPQATRAPAGVVSGRGTEAVTLSEAGVEDAVGIVAGTHRDADNLSIIMTARELNPEMFMVARQNLRSNDEIFHAAQLDLVMQRGSTIAHNIFALIHTPLLGVFLDMARDNDNDWANRLVSRISGVVQQQAPLIWSVSLSEADAPGMFETVKSSTRVTVGDVFRSPRDRETNLPCIALLHHGSGVYTLLPQDDMEIVDGDVLLFCGVSEARSMMAWIAGNENVFNYVHSGKEHASSYLGRLLERFQA